MNRFLTFLLVLGFLGLIAGIIFLGTGGLTTGDYPNWTGIVALILMCIFGGAGVIVALMGLIVQPVEPFESSKRPERKADNP